MSIFQMIYIPFPVFLYDFLLLTSKSLTEDSDSELSSNLLGFLYLQQANKR